MLRPYTVPTVEEVFHAPQIPRAFLADRGGEQHRPSRAYARDDHGFSHGDERGQAARVVTDARTLEPLAPPLDGDVHFGPEHRVEVGRQYDGGPAVPLPASPFPGGPPVHVSDLVDRDVVQADGAEQLGHVGGAVALGARRRRNRTQRRLARERDFVGTLEVRARGADAGVREPARDGLIHHCTVTALTVPGERATLGSWTSAS